MSYLSAFSYCLWGSCRKNTGVVCHFLLQWTMFYQNSSLFSPQNCNLFVFPLLNNIFFSGAMSGAWETKISHREKRQQRKRDKVQSDSGTLESSITPLFTHTAHVCQQVLLSSAFKIYPISGHFSTPLQITL